MEIMNKNLINQILWVIIIGVIIWFGYALYNEQVLIRINAVWNGKALCDQYFSSPAKVL